MFKSDKVTFNALKKMPVDKRVKSVQSADGPSILGALTPTEFALLFPKYYQERLPDVSGFREAMTKKSLQQRQEYDQAVADKLGIVSPADREAGVKEGRTAGGGKSAGGSISNPVMVKQIYDYLTKEKGVDHVHAMGIINNMNYESKFNSGVKVWDVNGPSGGLFQHHDNLKTGEHRFSDMVKFAGQNGQDWRTNWKGQIDFAMTEPDMKKYLASSYGDARAASIGFTKEFERPANTTQTAFDRADGVDKYEKFIKSGGEATATATTDTTNVSKVSDSKGGVYGSGQCVALSKHFSGLGAASGWKVSVNNSAIVPGAVIATTSYNDGSGGRMAKDMPDGKSHYHTGIALTAPDANGNVLILDQYKGRGAGVTRININDYHGEKWGIVDGGQPSAQTMQAVALGKSLANPDQLAWINSGATTVNAAAQQQPPGEAPKQKAPEPSAEQVAGHPESQKPSNATKPGQSQDTPTETATVKKPEKPSGVEYKFNEAAFEAAVRAKYGFLAAGYDRAGLVEEFKSKLPPGVTYENGVLKISDPNSPEIKTMRADLENEFGKKTVNSIVTENKPEQTATVEKNRQPAQAEEPPPQAHAGGGRESVRGPLSFIPIPPHRGDDMLATDASGKQFTFNKKENVKQDNSNTVKIEHRKDLGAVAAKYESAGKGVETVSSGFMRRGKKQVPDPGGVSYGSHQLSSRTPRAKVQTGGTMGAFLRSEEGKTYKDRFAGHTPGTAEFTKIYNDIAKKEATAFAKAQHDFITRTHYEPVREKAAKLGYNVNDPRLQEALYSISVQHGTGGASNLLKKAAHSTSGGTERQINTLFDVRSQRFHQLADRYSRERKSVLAFQPAPETAPVQYAQKTTPVQVAQAPTPGTPSQTTPTGEEPGKKTFAQRTQEALGIRTATAAPKQTTTTPPGPKSDVTPTPKVETPPMMAQQSDVRTELSALRNEMTGALQKVGQVEQKAPEKVTDIPKDDPTFLNKTLHQGDNPYMNPSFFRAVHRAKDMSEPTGGLNGLDGRHYSTGTKGA